MAERSLGRGGSGGARFFGNIGRWVVRHPWYPVIFWVVLLVIAVPFLSLLGNVTTNSFTTLPSNAPSAVAGDEFARLFPNESTPSSTTLLLYGPNLTDANGQAVVLNVTSALESDRSLTDVQSISSVYTTYSAYLAGQAEIAGGVLAPTLVAVNGSAKLLWAPPTAFLLDWTERVEGGTAPAAANYPAFESTNASLANVTASQVLGAFYLEFNGTEDCAGDYSTGGLSAVYLCATLSARVGEGPLIAPPIVPPSDLPIASAVLSSLNVSDWNDWAAVQPLAAGFASAATGLPTSFVLQVSNAFPGAVVAPTPAASWANATVARSTLAAEPLPVPYAIYATYVAPRATASVITVAFTVDDNYTNASGGSPVYSDLGKIDQLVPPVVRQHDATLTIQFLQTGTAPLDQLTNQAVNSSISLVLPIAVGMLLGIAMIYFRSPVAPLATFAALGIAIVLGLGGTVLIGTLIGHVNTTAETLEEVFVLGVGTDYSIFLAARYREELVHGKSSDEAIVAAMSWAGQSVATSGSVAIIATLGLALSGVALLAGWGEVLSLAILITVLVSLTLIPALLRLIGPRIFWPISGERFSRYAARSQSRLKQESTYFFRAGRATQRRPGTTVAVALVVSIPLIAVAVTAPLSYDFYAQLPTGQPATNGLAEFGNHFGEGAAVPSYALVTFRSPILVGNSTNATEMGEVAALTALASGTSGIASVATLVGPYGAPLGTWLNLSSAPLANRSDLLATAQGYIGNDGRTVLFDLVTTSSGLSSTAVSAVDSVESSFHRYAGDHPEIGSTAFGGGAPLIRDLAQQAATATIVLLLAMIVGLFAVLVTVLRSWVIAVLAVSTIGLSITWAWALTYLVFQLLLGFPIFFYVQTLLIMLVLGLGIDYTIFLLTRVREERLRGRPAGDAAVEAVARTGGIITAAAIILAAAFGSLLVGSFTLIRAIGFSVAIAVLLDAMLVRTYLVPAVLQLLGERAWRRVGKPSGSARPPVAPP